MLTRPPRRLVAVASLGAVLVLILAVAAGFLPPLSFVGLVALATFGLIALFRPIAGLMLLVVAVPFGEAVPVAQVAVGPLAVGPGEALVGSVLVGGLVGVVARRGSLFGGPLFWPIVAFIGSQLLATLFAEQVAPALKELLRCWTQLFVAYLAALNLLRDERSRRLVLAALLATGLAQSLVGIYQFFAVVGPEAFRVGGFLRAYGTFGQPNPFAGYLELVVPLALAVVVVWRPGLRDWLWWLALASALFAIAATVMSFSRGAWLGLAVGLAVAAGAAIRRGWLVVVVGGALTGFGYLAIAVGLVRGMIAQRLTQATGYFRLFDTHSVIPTNDSFAVVERMAHWQAGWEMFLDHPLVGVGPGNYIVAYWRYAILPYWADPLGHAHNIYLNIAAESGAIGLVAYVVMVGSWLFVGLSLARRLASRGASSLNAAIAIGVLGCLVSLAVHNVFDNLYVHMLNVQIGLLLGLLCAAASDAPAALTPKGSSRTL